MISNDDIFDAMTIKLDPELPEFVKAIRRAPDHGFRRKDDR